MANAQPSGSGAVIVIDSDEELSGATLKLAKSSHAEGESSERPAASQPLTSDSKTESFIRNDAIFQKFVTLCGDCIRKEKDGRAVLTVLRKRYQKASKAYRSSTEFRELLISACDKITSDPGKIFVYIKEVVGELKAYQLMKGDIKEKTAVKTSTDHGVAASVTPRISEVNENFGRSQHMDTETSSCAEVTVADVEATPAAVAADARSHGTTSSVMHVDCSNNASTVPTKSNNEFVGPEESKHDVSSNHVIELENLLEKYSIAIQKYEEKEVNMEDLLSPSSSYVIVGKLKARATKIFRRICDLKGRSHLTGRPIERKFKYSGTRYQEINKKIQSFINRPGNWEERMPDYNDIHRIVAACNARYNLGFTKSRILEVSKEAFTEVGNLLQEQRQYDFVSTFGSCLTDKYRQSEDPALYDKGLKAQLDANRDLGKSRLDEVINKYAYLEREETDNEKIGALPKPSCGSSNGDSANSSAANDTKSGGSIGSVSLDAARITNGTIKAACAPAGGDQMAASTNHESPKPAEDNGTAGTRSFFDVLLADDECVPPTALIADHAAPMETD